MVERLKNYLYEKGIWYEVVAHAPAYTTQKVAEKTHISGRIIAKTILVKINGELAMVVIPASHILDFEALKTISAASWIELANEQDCAHVFPDCELGSMPPFGNLYGLDVFVDESLAENPEILFHAGSHRELIGVAFSAFRRIVAPKQAKIAHIQHGEKKEQRPIHA